MHALADLVDGTRVDALLGQPEHIVVLMDAVIRLIERATVDVFADRDVQRIAQRLSKLVVRRVADITGSEPPRM
jgi:hypothetical protein